MIGTAQHVNARRAHLASMEADLYGIARRLARVEDPRKQKRLLFLRDEAKRSVAEAKANLIEAEAQFHG